MRTALIICWVLGGGGLGIQVLLALVSAIARAALPAERNSSLPLNALFFSALLSPAVALVALVLIALSGVAWLSHAPGPERLLFSRSFFAAVGLLVASLLWLVLQMRLFGGGIIPH